MCDDSALQGEVQLWLDVYMIIELCIEYDCLEIGTVTWKGET